MTKRNPASIGSRCGEGFLPNIAASLRRCASGFVSHPQLAVFAVVLASVLLADAQDAFARAGGGHSYSGGGSSSSSSSSSDGGGLIGLLIELIFRLLIYLVVHHPAIGIPLVIAIVVFFIWSARNAGSGSEWNEGQVTNRGPDGAPSDCAIVRAGRVPSARAEGESHIREAYCEIRKHDEGFSRAIFEDFIYSLYGRIQAARAVPDPELTAYVSGSILKAIHADALRSVEGVVIGGMRVLSINGLGTSETSVAVRIESNVTENYKDGRVRRLFLVQRLLLARMASARTTRDPRRARKMDCPNCGAPLDALNGRICTYCGNPVGDGRNDWVVVGIATERLQEKSLLNIMDAPEAGTNLPTVVTPGAQDAFIQLVNRHPEVSWQSLEARTKDIWKEVQGGWSNLDEKRFRPFVTDLEYDALHYWMDMYRKQGLRNVSDQGSVLKVELAAVDSDRFYDSVTVRVTASALDYTEDSLGNLKGGSRSSPRLYTEYWTLIRGSQSSTPPSDPAKCPSCGADLSIGMSGVCDYCHVRVTAGDFDWVLSRIEQDESYMA